MALFSKFENLTDEKKKRIIDVCIEEFSQNGYKNASTNNIVKKAEISKGILFYYFGNKKSLYLYVCDYVINFLCEEFFKHLNELPADVFERIMQIGIIKLRMAYEYPLEYRFALDALTHPDDDLKQDVQSRYDKLLRESMPLIFKDIDTSSFRGDIDRNKAMEIVMFTVDGLGNKYFKSLESIPVESIMSQLETFNEDFFEYMEILKKGVYDTGKIKNRMT